MNTAIPSKKLKKRKRIARPRTLKTFGALFLLLPLLNYAVLSYQLNVGIEAVGIVFASLNPAGMVLLLIPFAVGAGLLLVRKWGWWLFLAYSAVLVSYNVYVLIANPRLYNAGGLAQTVIGFGAILYFLQKDISAPYMKMYPRGWRLQHRHPIEMELRLAGETLRTRDISRAGFYADHAEAEYEPNQAVRVELDLDDGRLDLQAGIVRVDHNGIGVAFRDLKPETAARLEAHIEQLEGAAARD